MPMVYMRQNDRMLIWTEMFRIHRFVNTHIEGKMEAFKIWFTCMLTCVFVTMLFVQEGLNETLASVTTRVFRT